MYFRISHHEDGYLFFKVLPNNLQQFIAVPVEVKYYSKESIRDTTILIIIRENLKQELKEVK